jgi:hypothetical protein
MDYLTLRIPTDTKNKMTSTTWTGEPPWQGSNGMYEQCGCKMIQVVPAAYADIRKAIRMEGELFCDEEGLLNGKERNWRASQLRYWYMKAIEDQLTPDWRDWCNIVGDAVFVIEKTDKNLEVMEAILDS